MEEAGGKEGEEVKVMFSAGDLGWRKLEERREEVKVMFSAGDLGWRKLEERREEVKVMFSAGSGSGGKEGRGEGSLVQELGGGS